MLRKPGSCSPRQNVVCPLERLCMTISCQLCHIHDACHVDEGSLPPPHRQPDRLILLPPGPPPPSAEQPRAACRGPTETSPAGQPVGPANTGRRPPATRTAHDRPLQRTRSRRVRTGASRAGPLVRPDGSAGPISRRPVSPGQVSRKSEKWFRAPAGSCPGRPAGLPVSS